MVSAKASAVATLRADVMHEDEERAREEEPMPASKSVQTTTLHFRLLTNLWFGTGPLALMTLSNLSLLFAYVRRM